MQDDPLSQRDYAVDIQGAADVTNLNFGYAPAWTYTLAVSDPDGGPLSYSLLTLRDSGDTNRF